MHVAPAARNAVPRPRRRARDPAFDEGDYRWVAEDVYHLVLAEPDNAAAKALQAVSLAVA
jgi:alkyl sulfatase BDS1-like metallo-beta-lactamase superfamily hydrolase